MGPFGFQALTTQIYLEGGIWDWTWFTIHHYGNADVPSRSLSLFLSLSCLPLLSLSRFQTVYHTLEDTISAADAEEDLKWFRSNHGPGMPMNWPQFEVRDE